MRLPNGLVNHAKERLARVLAKHREERVGRVSVRQRGERLGRVLAEHGQQHLDRVLAKHSPERVARVVCVVLVLLVGGGTAAALAVLPPDLPGSAGERRSGPVGAAPSRIALGRLVAQPRESSRPGPAYYRRTASRHVPASVKAGFMPLYREAARTFGVSWRLLASVHRQETAFSTAPTTYHGLNAFGCCAGPMQFNVTNGPPSTWALYRQSFRRGDRPRHYPHRTRHHPSIYDDFDAIMAAAALLRDSGATEALGGGAWTAAYAYYGHDLFGVDYASQVVARAWGWERDGFCLNCAVDPSLVAKLDDAYGADARRALRAADRDEKEKKRKKRKKAKKAKQDREKTDRQADARSRRDRKRARSRDGAPRRAPAPQTKTEPEPPAATTTTTPTTTTEAPPAPPPPPPGCTGVKKLLGCG